MHDWRESRGTTDSADSKSAVKGKSKLSAIAAVAATDHETMRARTEGGGEMR